MWLPFGGKGSDSQLPPNNQDNSPERAKQVDFPLKHPPLRNFTYRPTCLTPSSGGGTKKLPTPWLARQQPRSRICVPLEHHCGISPIQTKHASETFQQHSDPVARSSGLEGRRNPRGLVLSARRKSSDLRREAEKRGPKPERNLKHRGWLRVILKPLLGFRRESQHSRGSKLVGTLKKWQWFPLGFP